MQDKTSDSASEARVLNRSAFQALQGLAEMQFKLLQRLGDMQREQFDRALTAAQDQIRVISQAKDPGDFVTAQTSLVQNYGQQYVRSIYEAATMMSQTWEEYAAQLQQGMSTAAATMQKAAGTATRTTQEVVDRSTQKPTTSKKTT